VVKMFESWQVVVGLIGFVFLLWGFTWLMGKAYRWRATKMKAQKMEKVQGGKMETEVYRPVPKKQRETPQLPQVGDEVFFSALRGRRKNCIRLAMVESVRRNSFVLRWLDWHGRLHRRSMTPSMLAHRQMFNIY